MVAKLIAEEGNLKGLVFSLEDDSDTWVIGRDPEECQLVIEDPQTSRRHLIARRTAEGFIVENLSTTNPIRVNEEEIMDEPRLLQQGDTIQIGNELFRFYSDTGVHVIEMENNNMQNVPPSTEENEPVPYVDDEQDTIFEDQIDEDQQPLLAQINFGLAETGRWLLKVISGPNNGAEFYMQAGHSYTLGTDTHSCDIVFHDTSVSRQHARITVSPEDELTIEDLKSRNGILVNNALLEDKQPLLPSTIVTMGTTSFVIYDREGEMQTIISPLLPSIVKVLQTEETPSPIVETPIASAKEERPLFKDMTPVTPVKPQTSWGSNIFVIGLSALFLLTGLGTISLFRSEPVVQAPQENVSAILNQALSSFPAVKYTFNPSTGHLRLIGHVSTAADKSQLLYNLQGLKFIKIPDDASIVIDEYVWQEINSVLARNPNWSGITVHSPTAGEFVLSGYLQSRREAEQLYDYISINFPYLDLLQKQIVVAEDVNSQINMWLQQEGLRNVTIKVSNGEITLTGSAPADRFNTLNAIVSKIKEIPGARFVNNLVQTDTPSMGIENITDQYEVSGQSRIGNQYTVIINGRILSVNDVIDGMKITNITPHMILLERDNKKYRIDYK